MCRSRWVWFGVIRINPREFDVLGKSDVGIPMGSLEALMGIDAALGDMPEEMDLDFTQRPR